MNHTPGWLVTLARAGYVTKGVVYAVIGVLALWVAVGDGGRPRPATPVRR